MKWKEPNSTFQNGSPLDIMYRLWICDAHSTMFRNQNCLRPPKHFIWLRKDEILHNFSVYLFKISGPIDIDYTKQMMVWWILSASFRMDDLMWNDVVRFGKLSFANGNHYKIDFMLNKTRTDFVNLHFKNLFIRWTATVKKNHFNDIIEISLWLWLMICQQLNNTNCLVSERRTNANRNKIQWKIDTSTNFRCRFSITKQSNLDKWISN